MLFHFRLVMTVIAGPGRAAGGVAGGAISVRSAVIDGEGMVESRPCPGGSCVTLRTLSIKVVGGLVGAMTGDAIGSSGGLVIEVSRPPTGGGVAGRALPGEVIGWFTAGVAGNAVGRPGSFMVESRA